MEIKLTPDKLGFVPIVAANLQDLPLEALERLDYCVINGAKCVRLCDVEKLRHTLTTKKTKN